MLSTVVVIDTTLPAASRMMKWDVPVGSIDLSAAINGASSGRPASGGAPAVALISRRREAT
jgi:hypothetical protein